MQVGSLVAHSMEKREIQDDRVYFMVNSILQSFVVISMFSSSMLVP